MHLFKSETATEKVGEQFLQTRIPQIGGSKSYAVSNYNDDQAEDVKTGKNQCVVQFRSHMKCAPGLVF